jgi:hypothetical protein
MDINSIVEKIKRQVGNKTVIAMWEMHSFGKDSGTGFCFRSVFQINRVVKQNERIKIFVDIELIDCWEIFEEKAKKVFLDIIRGEISNQIQGIENIVDIVIEEG